MQAVVSPPGFAQPQVGDRADDHRLGRDAGTASLGNLVCQAFAVKGEDGVFGNLGDDIVIVGIEPLGHLARRDARTTAICGGTAPCSAEVLIRLGAPQFPHALRKVTEDKAHVQHMVVQRKVANWHLIQVCLSLPVLRPQGGRRRQQIIGGSALFPIVLKREFQFPVGTDAGKSEVVCLCHDDAPVDR